LNLSTIKVDKKITEYFHIKTGVRQGCIHIQGENIEQVEQFVYLGGLINADGSIEKDIGPTKKNWMHVTSMRNDEQDMKKQRTNKENQD